MSRENRSYSGCLIRTLVEKKRDGYGRWPLENPHAGDVHFDIEDGAGKPSRWNTLRALRVLDWYSTRD